MPAVFDSSGPVREMLENFAPQVNFSVTHTCSDTENLTLSN